MGVIKTLDRRQNQTGFYKQLWITSSSVYAIIKTRALGCYERNVAITEFYYIVESSPLINVLLLIVLFNKRKMSTSLDFQDKIRVWICLNVVTENWTCTIVHEFLKRLETKKIGFRRDC